MKHRADVLQIERPGGGQTGGRHAVVKDSAPAASPLGVPAAVTEAAAEPVGNPRSRRTLRAAAAKARKASARKLDTERDPQPTEPQLDPQLHVVAGEEGTLAGDVVELAVPPAGGTVLAAVRTPVVGTTVAPVEPTAAAAVLETEPAVEEPVAHVNEAAATPTDAERAASPLTSVGKWRTRNLFRHLTFVLLIGSAATTGLAGRYYFESTTDSRMRLLVTSCLVVAGLWALLTATAPQVVTLKGSVLTVKSRRGTDRFDLAEGMQQLELIGEPGSSKWALVLHRGDNTVVRLGRRDVDARTLDPLVRQFRQIAERRRSEHWARMGL